MRRRAASVVFLLLLGGLAFSQDFLAVRVEMQVIASDPDATSHRLADWAEQEGGYFTLRSQEQVTLRVPPSAMTDIRSLVEDSSDTLVVYNPSAFDYGEEMRQITAAIDSRNEALDRILVFLEDASITATLSFEQELRSLLQEIEYYTGRQRRIANDVTYASATVFLRARQREIPDGGASSFSWVNSVDLYSFLEATR